MRLFNSPFCCLMLVACLANPPSALARVPTPEEARKLEQQEQQTQGVGAFVVVTAYEELIELKERIVDDILVGYDGPAPL